MVMRQPVVFGVGQLTNRATAPAAVREPLDLMVAAARRAAADAGIGARLAEVDELTVVNIISRAYADPAGMLAARLGMQPARRVYTAIGGNSPQWRVNETAARIARGEVRLALIVGAEAVGGLQLARKTGVKLQWAEAGTPETVGDMRWGNNAVEQQHQAQMPTSIYPLFENALRAHRGWTLERHRAHLGALCARFAAVAKDNPNAWFRDGKSAADISTVSETNRLIAWPYPKFMNAIIAVDQSAALLMADRDTALQLGVAPEKLVHLVGCGDATDHWFISDRANFWSSPALSRAGASALAQARLDLAQIDAFDIYSCFPSAVQISADMLGLALDDARPLTVTGGLPYHGGPGNNYVTHSIAQMVEHLRARPGSRGLVTGVGWYLTKHAVGVYQSAPPTHPFERADPSLDQTAIDAEPHPQLAVEASGSASVETYTVVHDRDGAPALGIVVGRLADGRRCWANVREAQTLAAMEQREFIGVAGQVRHDPTTQTNVFEP